MKLITKSILTVALMPVLVSAGPKDTQFIYQGAAEIRKSGIEVADAAAQEVLPAARQDKGRELSGAEKADTVIQAAILRRLLQKLVDAPPSEYNPVEATEITLKKGEQDSLNSLRKKLPFLSRAQLIGGVLRVDLIDANSFPYGTTDILKLIRDRHYEALWILASCGVDLKEHADWARRAELVASIKKDTGGNSWWTTKKIGPLLTEAEYTSLFER